MVEVIGHDQCVVNADVHQGFSVFVHNNIGHISIDIVSDIVVNEHGKTLMNVCNNNALVVANHLHHRERQLGDLSFMKRHNWISEIDLCIVKETYYTSFMSIKKFQDLTTLHYVQRCLLRLGRPRHLTLLQRVSSLGQHHYFNKTKYKMKKSISYKEVNLDCLSSTLQAEWHLPSWKCAAMQQRWRKL